MHKVIALFLLVTFSLMFSKSPEEGQYPLSEIKKLNLKKRTVTILDITFQTDNFV
jgi:hypothetical protein